jgi:hypothetical protein
VTTFSYSTDAHKIGIALIKDHFPDLVDVRIDYVFRDNTPVAGGREVWGKARKVAGLAAFLADHDSDHPAGDDLFVIEFAKPIWDGLDDDTKRALVDHELCHCVVKVDGTDRKLMIKTHDVEEFREIIERHGLWRPEVEAMAASIDSILE